VPSTPSTRTLLSNRTFRRLFSGHVVSVAGDALYLVAAMWLVYSLTGSSAATGLAGALVRAPELLRAFTGPLVDRFPLRRVLVLSEAMQGAVVLVVPVAAAVGALSVPVVLAVLPVVALVGQFAGPAQSATLPRVVDRDRVVDANSLIQFSTGSVRAAARAAAGAAIAAVGAAALYLADVATFAVAALAFTSLRVPGDGDADASLPSRREYAAKLREGVAVLRDSPLGWAVVAAATLVLLSSAATAVLPAFAASVGGPGTYGVFLAAFSAGTLAGTLLAGRVDSIPTGGLVAAAFAFGAATWTAAVFAPGLPATALLFAVAYVPIGLYNVLVSTALQVGVPEDTVGRVSAVTGSFNGVAAPAGLLLGGVAGDAFGPATVLLSAGVGFASAAAYWLLLPPLRSFPPVGDLDPDSFAA